MSVIVSSERVETKSKEKPVKEEPTPRKAAKGRKKPNE